MRGEWAVSIRQACRALRFDTSTYHYKSHRPGQAGLEQRIREICETRVRYGYLHRKAFRYLGHELLKPFSGPTVVITHFLPHSGSIAPKYQGSRLNPYFCADMSALIELTQPALWIHGHSHESCDYCVGNTRIISNPRGYAPDELNPAFDPGLVIEI